MCLMGGRGMLWIPVFIPGWAGRAGKLEVQTAGEPWEAAEELWMAQLSWQTTLMSSWWVQSW